MYLTQFELPRRADGMWKSTNTNQIVRLLNQCSAWHLIDYHHVKEEAERFVVTLFVTAGNNEEAALIGRLANADLTVALVREDDRL